MHREGNMSLYFLTAHFWVKLGTSEAWLRSLSVVFAVLAVVATALTIELILGRRAALAGALLLGTNPFFLTYAREARSYSLVLFMTVCASYCFVRLWRTESKGWRIGYVAFLTLSAYAHMIAILAVIGHIVALTIGRRWTRRWAFTYGAVGLCLVPLLAYAALNNKGQTSWIERPDTDVLQDFAHRLIGNNLWQLFCAALVVAALFFAVRAGRTGRASDRIVVGAGVTAVLAPVLIVYAVSQSKPLFVDKYMIFVLPALVLVLVYAVVRMPGGVAVTALLTLALAAHWLRVDQSILGQQMRYEDLRSAAAHVSEQGRGEDALLFVPSWSRLGFEHYATQVGVAPRDVALAPGGTINEVDDILAKELAPEQIEANLDGVKRVWVVGYDENGWPVAPEPAAEVHETHVDHGDWVKVDSQRFGSFEVNLYEVAAN